MQLALLVVLTVLTATIALALWRIVDRLERLLRALAPVTLPELDELVGDDNRPRTILDQLTTVAAHCQSGLSNLENVLRYLRGYVWEVHDPRLLDDIRHPKESPIWRKTFQPRNEDPADYGLWRRERDYEEGFERDVVRPTREQQPLSNDGE